MRQKLAQYAVVPLTTNLNALTAKERAMLPHLIAAAKEMDALFWLQAYGDADRLLNSLDDNTRRFVQINYGPWDRLNGNEPFVPEAGPKPAGANFYPVDMTKDEYDRERALSINSGGFSSLYTMIRRDRTGRLTSIPYHEFFPDHTARAAEHLRQAAQLAEDPGLAHYLGLRVDALLNDDYRASDLAWLDMKDNVIDCVIGPIETYEDQLFGQKAAYEAYVLVKDRAWSQRLSRYARLLPELQRGLPVADEYKTESPGTDSDLNAYDVIYYAGDCNAGSKTIAINLPNDEVVQQQKGSRRLQLKNAMRAKFDRILTPITNVLIAADQRPMVTFPAFFGNTMFHEVAHGLGISHTITNRGTVRESLQELASTMEEGKADVLGLYMVTRLFESGELTQGRLMDHYVTFLAGIFRSVRFGASSAHGRANMLRFNFFKEMGAFERDEASGTYRVKFDAMENAVTELSRVILTLQGDGNYPAVKKLLEQKGTIRSQLQEDLDRLEAASIPVDIVFDQGLSVLNAAP